MEKEPKKIKKIINDFFKHLDFDAFIEEIKTEDGAGFNIKIRALEAEKLIGKNGQTLNDLQKLIYKIGKKIIGDGIYLNIDINDYKTKREAWLKQLADEAANDVSLTKKEKALPPMPASERRLIHLHLANRGDVLTESQGEGRERKIIIKPKN